MPEYRKRKGSATSHTCCTVSVVLLLLVGYTSTPSADIGRFAESRQRVPERTATRYEDFGGSAVTVEFSNEVLYDPDASMLFSSPQTYPAVSADSKLYWADIGGGQVHVTDRDMNHLFSFGRKGQGPGEFDDPWLVDIAPSGQVFVFDRGSLLLHQFTPDGSFVQAFRLLSGVSRAQNLMMLSDDRIVINVTSLQPTFHGAAAHFMRLEGRRGGIGSAVYDGSFAEVPDYDLGVYGHVAGGFLTRDLDGGFLYTENNRYSLSKFDVSGRLVWKIEEPAAFPPALESYRFSPNGTVFVPHHANSISLIPLGNDLYLHTFRSPPAGFEGTRDAFPEGVHWQVSLELIRVRGRETTRAVAPIRDSLHLLGRSRGGDYYGFLWGDALFLVRSEIEVKHED